MKKIILLLLTLCIFLLTSCAEPKNNTVPEAVGEVIEEDVDDEVDENDLEQNDPTVIEEIDLAEEIKIDTGRFIGLADENFFEVKISGVPDSIPPKVFMLTDEVREKFLELNLQLDDEIKLHYYETNDGQLAVTDIEKISQ